MSTCNYASADRRRTFWTTQPCATVEPGACGTYCSTEAGLILTSGCAEPNDLDTACPVMDPVCVTIPECEKPRTIVTTEWVRGLALNMLLTDGRLPDTNCGIRPGSVGGHWSESFMTKGKPVGTQLRRLRSATSVADMKSLVKTYAEATLQKLLDYGVATSISAEVTYRGANVFGLSVEIYGTGGDRAVVALAAQRTDNSITWVN